MFGESSEGCHQGAGWAVWSCQSNWDTPTNKKQCKSGENDMQHETWRKAQPVQLKRGNAATINTGKLSIPYSFFHFLKEAVTILGGVEGCLHELLPCRWFIFVLFHSNTELTLNIHGCCSTQTQKPKKRYASSILVLLCLSEHHFSSHICLKVRALQTHKKFLHSKNGSALKPPSKCTVLKYN